jgi:hypothetical protein
VNRNEGGAYPPNVAPILGHESYAEPPVFTPANLLREARRQKELAYGQVPQICEMDPDGDIVEYLRETGRAEPDAHWACNHTRLFNYTQGAVSYGIVGGADHAGRSLTSSPRRSAWLAWNEQVSTGLLGQ